MILGILRLKRTITREIMKPLVHVVALQERDLTWERIVETAKVSGHSRFPVYSTYVINLIGHIDIYEVLRGGPKSPQEIRALVHPPHYVPETKRVDALLQEFLVQGRRVAIVIDEHGGCSGWVTREDILEEIFGDIADESDRERPSWTNRPNGAVVFDAGVDLDDVNFHFGLALPRGHCDTLGGFIYERLGRVPRVGETVRHGGHRLRVHAMNAQQIVSVRLEPSEGDAQRTDQTRSV
jgi:CBS domain containing-hemolysin-like protein